LFDITVSTWANDAADKPTKSTVAKVFLRLLPAAGSGSWPVWSKLDFMISFGSLLIQI
jgi:hypothetical protein